MRKFVIPHQISRAIVRPLLQNTVLITGSSLRNSAAKFIVFGVPLSKLDIRYTQKAMRTGAVVVDIEYL